MVEVFKTDVYEEEKSLAIVETLLQYFPDNEINFDLQDCDKILRIEGENVLSERIKELLNEAGYRCEVLD
ncbi:MAG TPA: hypothetical protein VFF57_06055 [Hanamia sp.]|jgi:hypothetical protein|uniref:HMA domain-containing protein n=1 Tax=Hanamia caeni TaxID=2294116 RepID=A0A3M9N7T6_9BACT|nr:hypothetical protein [Hanamia caeni]RNI33796.1 hypothetical protein EFY79_17545 [Hanamia caeni]HZW70418.1 hypothetical protein [Hanamia sp.]